jgi:ABC-type glutathione transport system ATPase component
MPSNRVLEQHIAVFGESGSGKTVMLSSFYESEQERRTSGRAQSTWWRRTPAKARTCTRIFSA